MQLGFFSYNSLNKEVVIGNNIKVTQIQPTLGKTRKYIKI